jgi:hypothetical protein
VTELAPALGVLAALVGIADTIPYLRDMLRGSTRPHRGTWLIWSSLAVLVCFSQEADGASWSLLMTAVQGILTSLIFVLAIRHGEGGLSLGDLIVIALAAAGVAGWISAGEPLVATACVVAADLLGAGMMLPKTWRDPGSETLSTFALAAVAGALAAGAVGSLDVALLLYPAYFCLVNLGIALIIQQRRRMVRGHPGPPALAAPRSAIAGGVGRLAGVLHLDHVAPGVRGAAVDVGEPVLPRELAG